MMYQRHKRQRRLQGPILAAMVMAVTIGAMSSGARSADDTGTIIEEARTALEKWVETRRIISQEKRDRVLARELLEERIDLVKRDIESLRTKTTEKRESIVKTDEEFATLSKRSENLRAGTEGLEARIDALEARTRAMLPKLPQPIRDRIKLLSDRLPQPTDAVSNADADEASEKPKQLSLTERYQNVVGILNEINKFNREITVVSEVRELPSGGSVEVSTIYVGISQGYYVNNSATAAGTGCATDTGWQWTQANEHAEAIAKAVAILKNEEVASFVRLPLHID